MAQVVHSQYPLRHVRSPFHVKSDQLNQRDDYMDPGERCKPDVFVTYPYLLRPKWCVMASPFHDSSPLSLHSDRKCSRYLERSCSRCPCYILIVSWFWASGFDYAYDFIWDISVTHESCLYTDVRLQEKLSNEYDNRDPPPTTFLRLYTWGRDFFNVFSYYCICCSGPINFSLLKIFCSSTNVLLA